MATARVASARASKRREGPPGSSPARANYTPTTLKLAGMDPRGLRAQPARRTRRFRKIDTSKASKAPGGGRDLSTGKGHGPA